MKSKIKSIAISILFIALIATSIYSVLKNESHKNKISELHGEISQYHDTIEIKESLYEKSVLEIEDLNGVVSALSDDNDKVKASNEKLRKEIKERDLKVRSLNKSVTKWKNAYEAEIDDAQQDEIEPGRMKVTFNKDFGYIGINGYTITNPPEAYVKVEQMRPLVLTLALTQNSSGEWYTLISSSEENVSVDVELSSVNPFIDSSEWYEKFYIFGGLGIGDGLFEPSIGIGYDFGGIIVYPEVSYNTIDGTAKYSLNAGWNFF